MRKTVDDTMPRYYLDEIMEPTPRFPPAAPAVTQIQPLEDISLDDIDTTPELDPGPTDLAQSRSGQPDLGTDDHSKCWYLLAHTTRNGNP